MMKFDLASLVILLLLFVTVHSADSDLQANKTTNGGDLSQKKPLISKKSGNIVGENVGNSEGNVDSKIVDPLKKVKEDSHAKQNGNLVKENPSELLGDKQAENVQTDVKSGKSLKNGEKNVKADLGLRSKDVPRVDDFPSTKKRRSQGEQCGSSFTCTDENRELVACLRVPGNESPEFSLLLQNKGKGPMTVKINAPDFVNLEKTEIQLPETQDQQVVKVSIGDGKTDKFIVLNTGKGKCSLDFQDFLTHNPMKKSNYMSQLTYINLFRQNPFLGLLFLALLAASLIIASILTYISFKRRRLGSNGSTYQRLGMEIPVVSSGEAKTDLDVKDGWDDRWSDDWDDRWSDDWDDVEAPTTPSMPVTPSLSVASRRINKEGWKD